MRALLTRRARRDLERIDAWTRLNLGTRPTALLEELRATLRLLRALPEHGVPFCVSRGRLVRRVLMRASQLHVYYVVDPERLRVLTLWSTARGRAPRFGPP